ncbi:MAG TPA: DUF933 domain-containing protein [Deltaproteobacteria bacterium]|jgi:hypothetical protein|nr:YchF family ATPase [Deltaproteobacteria bacterium]MDI9542202.1 DUF933 domain-containing protein [Pseudomonadota bacterium]NLW66938.1 redox-regulated ATPase YchF [Bacteriovoracaceae bacterium]HON62118.1 DUF933 domain-containing protein [Deltaproteobacteria bacterium]HPA84882.1 DUF933 domain-containing protein [Deltaproteobacteria bacterium]
MKIGLIGLEKSGKTTVFNALTGSNVQTSAFSSSRPEPNIAVVAVADPRVDRLRDMYHPKKTTYAFIECIDFVGFSSGEERKEIFSASELALVKNADALALVLRNFNDELIDSVTGPPDPLADLNTIVTELVLSDLILAENRLERIEHFIRRGASTPDMEVEKRALVKVRDALGSNALIRSIGLSPEETRQLRGFRFLTEKPLMVIVNSDENRFGQNGGLLATVEETMPAVEFAGRFEMELSGLSEEDAREFMEDMNIEASARDRLTMLAYRVLGYITFFTVGQDEVKAWTIMKGGTAVDAAGAIHSDLARGFIRAECFSYCDLMELGSEKALRDKGLFRLEGKNYLVKDGDIMSIRFSV